jgi:tetratricopeptide (TPR) repeat protein
MRRFAWIFAAVLCVAAPVAQAAREETAADRAGDAVEQLIAQLGSDEYAVRRRAEEQLLRLGPEAFDKLKAAENDADLEVAERIRYIVQRMRVSWVHAEDSPEVRNLLSQFGELSVDDRYRRVRALAALDDHAGLGALCRITRFDPSALVARQSALAVLTLTMSRDERQAAAAACRGELGTSERPPAHWIRLFLRELDDPQQAVGQWTALNAAESELLRSGSPETDFALTYDLLLRHLDRCDKLKLTAETGAALLAIVDLATAPRPGDDRAADPAIRARRLESSLAGAIRWTIDHKRADVLEPLEDRFESTIRHSRKLLYFLAAASAKAGRDERAAALAEQAYNLPPDDDALGADRSLIAGMVAELGFVDWAEREYRWIIANRPVIDEQSMDARSDLAIWLHDREDYAGAADILGEFCRAIAADPAARQRLIEELDLSMGSGIEMLRTVEARRDFYRACVAEAKGDYQLQRRRLEDAIKKYDKDPDILIAMYRSPGADDDFRQRTRVRIRSTAKFMQALIDENPDNATCYNQWAWLIANTEGDQQLAVQYSQQSLVLRPDEPSYLDTLGRCYYAVGDYARAVESQRRAVELAPHYGVMRRQLAAFEQALAEHPDGDMSRGAESPSEGDERNRAARGSAAPGRPPASPAGSPDPFGGF